MSLPCPVCRSVDTRHFQSIDERSYWRCDLCQSTYLDPAQHPDRAREKAEYDRHENNPQDPAYRRFLNRLAAPLIERLEPGSKGLDFGCGPGPALAQMLEESGFAMSLYDPIYAPDGKILERPYDFITCTEVVEHFHRPAEEFERLFSLLKPGGWLGLMTRLQTDDDRFAGWHYRRDPTHVVFYRETTFLWLAKAYGMTADIIPPDAVLMKRKA